MTMNSILFAVGMSWFGVAWYWYVPGAVVCLILASRPVLIRERQVGIVVKRFSHRSLAPGCRLARLNMAK